MKIAKLAALIAFASCTLFAQSPFDGTWALNQRKSDITGTTMKIEDAGNGAIKFMNPNFTTTVRTDGTKAQTPAGQTMAMQKKSNDSYHQTVWFKGKELSQSDWELSNGGKTLTVRSYGTRPDGHKFDNTETYTRVSGDSGLAGEWKTSSIKLSNPATFTIKMSGDQMTWDIPAIKGTWTGKTDGKEYRPTGPTVPETLTLTVTKQGPRAISITEKLKGKTVFTGTYTVSEDGKTMTVEGKNAKGEPTKEVWEKQG